jgi:ubiquinone biosynthesis protein
MTENGLVLDPATVADIGHAEARRNRFSALALWVIAALLACICYVLLHGP